MIHHHTMLLNRSYMPMGQYNRQVEYMIRRRKPLQNCSYMPLDLYIGPCQVVTPRPVSRPEYRLVPGDIECEITERRVLLRTESYPDPNTFNTDFTALSADLVDFFADKGVRLVGIDTPSVDPAEVRDLTAHHQFLHRNVAILEGIVLTDVPDGRYELIALPLKLAGFDASPVRAVLRELAE